MSQILKSRPLPNVPLQFTTDAGIAIPSLNNVNVFGGIGASTTGVGSTITVNVNTSGFKWNVVTSTTNPNSLLAENGYIPKGAGIVSFILPAAAAVGDSFVIAGYGNLWTLTQNAGQSITLGIQTSTIGVGGNVSASQVRDTIELVCVTANTEFQIINGIGNLIFV